MAQSCAGWLRHRKFLSSKWARKVRAHFYFSACRGGAGGVREYALKFAKAEAVRSTHFGGRGNEFANRGAVGHGVERGGAEGVCSGNAAQMMNMRATFVRRSPARR